MAAADERPEKHHAIASGHDIGTDDPESKQRPRHYSSHAWADVAANGSEKQLEAFGGAFQPGLYSPPTRQFANPAPLGLSAFALSTFVLSLINVNTRHIGSPSLVVALAYGYGGLVQLLAGMWAMAVGNTFAATALSSYGGFWFSFAIILTPGFQIESALTETGAAPFLDSFGLYLMGWFIFTTILLLCTMRSTVAFFTLFFTLDLTLLMLSIGYLQHDGTAPQPDCIVAGGAFGLVASFLAWYNALAGIADSSNSFFVVPVVHFPWSEKAREGRVKINDLSTREGVHAA